MIRKVNHKIFILVLLVAALPVVHGCKKKEEPPPQPASQPQQQPAAKVALPVQKQSTSAKVGDKAKPQFDFSRMKDPFRPFVVDQPPAVKQAAEVRKETEALPMQSYDLSKFKVSGIIVGLKENSALIVDPAGKGYVVKQGMMIGTNNGRISRITASSVEVIEQFREDSGRIRKKTVKLTLPQKSKEATR